MHTYIHTHTHTSTGRLEKDNCFVIAAGDGEEALAKFNQQRPDIVISDVFMPKMDGFELCRQIRKIDSTIPIVMLTSMNDVKDRISGLDAGADDYIVKPFSPKVCVHVFCLSYMREVSVLCG
jgi:OmpR family response regulator RpaB